MATIAWTTHAEPYRDPVTAKTVEQPRYTAQINDLGLTICAKADGSWAVAEGNTLLCDGFSVHTEAMAWVERTFSARSA